MLELIEQKNFDGLIFYIAVRIVIVLICWIFMVVANLIDFWSGITTAKALGESLMSHGFRRTIVKVGDYVRVMLFALMFDMLGSLLSFYAIPFATILCTVAIIWIEGKSVIENSRHKKAHAADVPEIVKQIVQCATTEKGLEIFNRLQSELSKPKSDEKN